MLAELDYTVNQIRSRIILKETDNDRKRLDRYLADIEAKNKNLYGHNYILIGMNKDEFLHHSDYCFEIRLDDLYDVIEMEYTTTDFSWNGDFMQEALVPHKDNPHSFDLVRGAK